jgi:NOL1/NOP2/fmu family ribosome biogenesis protein
MKEIDMELKLTKITANGIELTVTEARKYIANRKIQLPEALYEKMIGSYIKRQGKAKNPVPSNRVFSSNNINLI